MVTYICEYCTKIFSKKSAYIAHINRKNKCGIKNINKLQCIYCKNIYANLNTLKLHKDKYCKKN